METATARRVQVTRAQVAAAKGRIITDRRQGRPTPSWVFAVAAACAPDRDLPPEPNLHNAAAGGARRRKFTVTMVPDGWAWRTQIRPDVLGIEPIVTMPGEGEDAARQLIADALQVPPGSLDIDFQILDPGLFAGTPVLRSVDVEIKDELEIAEAHRILTELERRPVETDAELLSAYDDLKLTTASLLEILGQPTVSAGSTFRDGRHLRAARAALAAHKQTEDALAQAIQESREAGDSRSMIAIALDLPEREVRRRFARDGDG